MRVLTRTKLPALTMALGIMTSFGFVNVASALPATTAASSGDSAKIHLIISRGNTEISRRLTVLNTLASKVSAATKLTASDKASLSGEVSSEVGGLTALKAKLDADTDLTTAKADANSIFTEYRVFALVVPQVGLVKTADDQQTAEAKLSDLATKLQGRITGTNATLSDMQAKLAAATSISSSIESQVVILTPTDYNTDHTVLSGDVTQLKTAQSDNQAAAADARNLIASLKS
jgi:ATP-dependent protease HslVU (ClpYQ) ATPase subunit